jgi:septum formation protein
VDEGPRRRETPAQHTVRLAEVKARRAVALMNGADGVSETLVLGADTVVACGRRILPKADDEAEARTCLSLLSGRRHRVLGGVCVITPDGRAHRRLATTRVAFKRLEALEIENYLASEEWRGKAGAYAIQGRAAAFVARVNGSYSNVVGLPLFETAALLRGLGLRT